MTGIEVRGEIGQGGVTERVGQVNQLDRLLTPRTITSTIPSGRWRKEAMPWAAEVVDSVVVLFLSNGTHSQ